MAAESTMLALGTTAPPFELSDTVTNATVSVDDFADRSVLVVMFICSHCPYVLHVLDGLVALGNDYSGTEVGIVAISSNDPGTHPEDAPEELATMARSRGFAFPFLFDATQDVAKAYTAACTPDFFVFGADRRLAYRGQFDTSRPSNDLPVTGESVRAAVEALRAGEAPSLDQVASIGCSIKWRPGNEPAYG